MYRRTPPRASRRVSLLFLFLFFENIAVFAVNCPKCKQSYPDFTRLAVHAALEHKLWLCPKCPETFGFENKEAYWLHRKKEHEEIVCLACNLRAFSDENEWEYHCKKHEEKVLFLPNGFPCCPQMPSDATTVWVRKLHAAHRHGSWIDFLCKVRPLHECCELFRNAIFETVFSDWDEGKFMSNVERFSKHVYDAHGLCFFCERKLDNTDMFERQTVQTYFFLNPRGNMFSLKKENFTCYCGKNVQHNAESRLFALKIDRLPFGTGLDTVTHPFYCIIDENENEKKDHSERGKARNAVSSKSDASIRKDSEEPKENSHTAPPPPPPLSTKSIDTTLTSVDDKKYKKLPAFDTDDVSLTDNEINVK